VHMLEFPLRWGLQKELGRCYVKIGGIKSALDIFTKLAMWSEVVSCYMALKKKKRAKRLLDELLAKRPTPELLYALPFHCNLSKPGRVDMVCVTRLLALVLQVPAWGSYGHRPAVS